jgi:NAD(P)-dependent dehydrogenase (short-subunit alcohol dehydrogenase family)
MGQPLCRREHGVVSLTKTGAVNGGPYDVRVNCVAPGLVVTRLTDVNESVAADAAEARAAQIGTVPLGRAGSPDDVAGWSPSCSATTRPTSAAPSSPSTGGAWPTIPGLAYGPSSPAGETMWPRPDR